MCTAGVHVTILLPLVTEAFYAWFVVSGFG